MRDKKGIVFVSFDLPASTLKEKAVYRKFHSYLIKSGYMEYQKSLYFKILKNISNSHMEIQELEAVSPRNGNISVLPLTLSEVYKIRTIRGSENEQIKSITEDVFFF